MWDCGQCMESLPVEERRAMHCGWMPEEEWTVPARIPRVGDPVYTGDVCPAWLVRQPAVHDAAEAAAALEAGALAMYDPGGKAVVWEAAIALKRSEDRHTMITMPKV